MQISLQSELIENSITRSTSLLTPEDQVKTLMQQVAHDCGLELSMRLPSPAAHAVPAETKSTKNIFGRSRQARKQ
jgi:charged multivesicular body protein 1